MTKTSFCSKTLTDFLAQQLLSCCKIFH